jgi:cytochrome c oxidase subunit III
MHRMLGGWALLTNGLLLILYVIYVWWRGCLCEEQHSFVVQRGLRLGMVLFIVSEIMFFCLFRAFFHSSLAPVPVHNIGGVWPPAVNP